MPTLDENGLESEISKHFGKTLYFTIIEFEDDEIKDIKVIESISRHKGGTKTPSEIIIDSKADMLICGGLGSKAVSMLQNKGITVFSGATGKVKDVINEWKQGKLPIANEGSCVEGH